MRLRLIVVAVAGVEGEVRASVGGGREREAQPLDALGHGEVTAEGAGGREHRDDGALGRVAEGAGALEVLELVLRVGGQDDEDAALGEQGDEARGAADAGAGGGEGGVVDPDAAGAVEHAVDGLARQVGRDVEVDDGDELAAVGREAGGRDQEVVEVADGVDGAALEEGAPLRDHDEEAAGPGAEGVLAEDAAGEEDLDVRVLGGDLPGAAGGAHRVDEGARGSRAGVGDLGRGVGCGRRRGAGVGGAFAGGDGGGRRGRGGGGRGDGIASEEVEVDGDDGLGVGVVVVAGVGEEGDPHPVEDAERGEGKVEEERDGEGFHEGALEAGQAC